MSNLPVKIAVANSKLVDGSVNFTPDQKEAVDGIIDFINAEFSKNHFAVGLCGPGGVGKTFVTNYIISTCKYANSAIRCTSPTHKACRVFSAAIGGKDVYTIQATFGFRLDLNLENFNPDRPQFNPKAKAKLDNIRVLFIDESSMLPASLVGYIMKTCKEKQIKIIFIGDDNQLPPVNEKKSTAFARCAKIYYLTTIVRQEQDNPIRGLLQMLRKDIDNRSFNFINYISKHIGESYYNEVGEGFTITNPLGFKQCIDISFNDEKFTENIDMYRIIAYTNLRISSWNNYVRNYIIKGSDKGVLTKNDLIMSNETIVDDFLSPVIINSEEYIIKDIVNYVDSTYGFKGYMVKFQLIHGGKVTSPLFVIDSKDINSIILYDRTLNELLISAKQATGGTRVSKWKEYFNFKKKYLLITNIVDRNNNIKTRANIDYGFAITSHKSQGSTYDNVFVDINDIVFDRNNRIRTNTDEVLRMLYVACSRARKQLILCYGN